MVCYRAHCIRDKNPNRKYAVQETVSVHKHSQSKYHLLEASRMVDIARSGRVGRSNDFHTQVPYHISGHTKSA